MESPVIVRVEATFYVLTRLAHPFPIKLQYTRYCLLASGESLSSPGENIGLLMMMALKKVQDSIR